MKNIFLALVFFFGVILASCSWQPRPIGWSKLRPSGNPPPLVHSSVVYDINSNEAVLFGGITENRWSNETWVWNSNGWFKARPSSSPPAREKAAMAYDESRDRVVLFGGAMDTHIFDDTWEWDGRHWQLMDPLHKPPARCCHALAYDSVQQKVLLYGGWSHVTGEFFNDTWEWDGNDWVEITCCDIPASAAHTLVNFSDENKIIAVPSAEFINTWVWDGTKWDELSVRPNLTGADGRSAYYGKGPQKQVILFGGIRDDTFLNETWAFDGQIWKLLGLPIQPFPRYGHVMFYDAKRQSIILFGGTGSEGFLQDTWELNLPEDLSGLLTEATATP